MAIDRQKKGELLDRTVKHVDITAHDTRALVDAYKEMSFSARELGRACEIYEQMLQDDQCTIILTVAGSTSAAGCMQIYVDLLRHNMVDIVVATGATVVDMDFLEALGFAHYRGTQFADDAQLRDLYIDRIYDTYIDE
jgi:deoxyhypusine synthase